MYYAPPQSSPLQQKYEKNDLTMYPDENHEPYLDIIENPKARGFRFRYTCEGPSHGGIPGASSDKNKKTYPAVQIKNYTGYARIVVQLVTNEENPRLHPHSLVGKQCQNGICTVQCGPKDMTATFPNLGIQHVTKKNVAKILEERYLAAELQLSSLTDGGLSDDVRNNIKDEDKRRIHTKAANEAKSIDLSVVRLMFIAYLPDATNAFTLMLKPVISDAIFDSKAPNAATLKICRMDKSNGAANGMDEIYMLCDKVQKDDIQVRFYEETQSGEEIWEAYGEFSPTDVHRQFAIVFRTPRYKNVDIDSPVHVQVQLRRKSDGEVSEPRPFTYMPVQDDPEKIGQKRRKIQTHYTDHISGPQVNGSSGSQAANASTRYTQGGFVYQTSSNNHTGGKQNGRPAPPKDHCPQKGPVDPFLLLQRTMQPKQEPQSPSSMMQSPSSIMNGYGSPGSTSNYSATGSPHSECSNGLNTQMSEVNFGSTHPDIVSTSLDLNSINPQSANMTSTPMFIQGTQIPIPRHVSQYAPQQIQYTVMELPAMQNSSPQINMNGQYVYTQIPPGAAQDNVLYYNTTNVNTINGQVENPMIFQEEIVDSSQMLDEIIALSQSGMTETIHTISGSGVQHASTEVMEILLNSVEPDSVVETRTNTQSDTSGLDKDDFCRGMQYTEESPQMQGEDATPNGSKIEGDTCIVGRQAEIPLGLPNVKKTTEKNEKETTKPPQTAPQEVKIGLGTLDKKSLQKLLIDITVRTARAMQEFASTGDIRIMLATQRRLTDVEDKDGDTPLHLAVINGQDHVLHALIQLIQTIPGNSDIINRQNDKKLTPLHVAVHSENANAVKWLMGAGADALIGDTKGNTAIHLACINGQTDILEIILMHTEDSVEPHNYNGLTPLHLMVKKMPENSRQCFALLINHGHDVDSADMKSGRTALHIAAEDNNLVLAGHLISEFDADLESRTYDGLTPLHIAAARDCQDIATLLLACGADPQAEFSEDPDSTPSSLCSSQKMKDLLEGVTPLPLFDDGSSIIIDDSEDLWTMDPLLKLRLCRMLDPRDNDRDWYALAKRLGLGTLISLIEENEKSPTETLLENYSCLQGTVSGLREALTQIDRQDAIDLLTKSNDADMCGFSSKHDLDDIDRIDSAIGSMSLSEPVDFD